MVAFRRVFLDDPGNATFLNVASTNIIDRAPPQLLFGAGTGTILIVGETEKGPIGVTTEVTNPTSREQTFGGLGWPITGVGPHVGPVAQQSGGSEAWNGNVFVWTANKVFNRLLIHRVDSSAGVVELTRLACLNGGSGPFSAANGDQAVFDLNNGATTATATLNATKASILASGVVYPLPLGTLTNKTLIVAWDDASDADAQTITFASTDITLADVIARINAKVAATIAFDNGGQLELRSVRAGSEARIKIVGGTALSDLGLPTAVVQDVWTLTVTGDSGIATQARVSRIVDGVATDFDTASFSGVIGSVTLKRDKLLSDAVTDPPQLSQLGVPGFIFAASGIDAITVTGADNQILTGLTMLAGGAEVTVANTVPGVALEVFGTGNVGDASSFSAQEAAAILDAAANLGSTVNSDGTLRACNELTPGTGAIKGDSGALLAALGFDTTTTVDAANGPDLTIPAGTRVQDATSTATVWITMSDVQTGTGGGPFEAKVRPFDDTDAALASGPNDVTVILSDLPGGFAVTNPLSITRLTSAQLDSRYIAAIRETNVDAPPAREANAICSARTSPAINNELQINAREATAAGLSGRKTIVRPRLGVSVDDAVAENAALREERKQFAFPGFQARIQEIAEQGASGGVGFTDDGVVPVGADSWLAAIRSIIPPEQSSGQDLRSTNVGRLNVAGLEPAYDPLSEGSTKLDVNDYIRFKREGITAPILDRTAGAAFVDDVTSVDSLTQASQTPANRRWFADFINDSLFILAVPYGKKLITQDLRRNFFGQIINFLTGLQSLDQPQAQRIESFDVTDTSDPDVPNILRARVAVRMLATADAIVFDVTVGQTVVTSAQVTAAAA